MKHHKPNHAYMPPYNRAEDKREVRKHIEEVERMIGLITHLQYDYPTQTSQQQQHSANPSQGYHT